MIRKGKDNLLLVEIDVDTPEGLAVGGTTTSIAPASVTVHSDEHGSAKGKQRVAISRDLPSSHRYNNSHTSQDDTIISVPDSDTSSHRVTLGSSSSYTSRPERSFMMAPASETADNVKCVVSTVLFLSVVVGILMVAILKNPGM